MPLSSEIYWHYCPSFCRHIYSIKEWNPNSPLVLTNPDFTNPAVDHPRQHCPRHQSAHTHHCHHKRRRRQPPSPNPSSPLSNSTGDNRLFAAEFKSVTAVLRRCPSSSANPQNPLLERPQPPRPHRLRWRERLPPSSIKPTANQKQNLDLHAQNPLSALAAVFTHRFCFSLFFKDGYDWCVALLVVRVCACVCVWERRLGVWLYLRILRMWLVEFCRK